MALRRPGADPHIQRVFKDTYRVQEFLGQGGMGRAYKGEHLRLKKPIVIKVLGDELKGSEEFVARFRKEAILQAMVNHPCAVQTIDLDEAEDGTLFIVLEFAPGETLDKVIRKEGKLSVERSVDIARQILEILSVAHGAKIIHRDLKPENILVERRGDEDIVRILDFGISVLMNPGEAGRIGKASGTPYYMAPEGAAGETVDGRADLYSVGVIMFQMITGELPIHDENVDRFFSKLLNDYPAKIGDAYPELGVPKAIEEVVFTSLSKDPFNRYKTADEMLQALGGNETKKSKKFILVATISVLVAGAAIGYVLTRDNYQDGDQVAANMARDVATASHPGYAAADLLWQDAEKARQAGDYPRAYELFRNAQKAFADCVPYQSADQEAAENAKKTALAVRPEHVLTRLGLEVLAEAEQQIASANYEGSYRTYKNSLLFFQYDDAAEKSAADSRSRASPDHPAFKSADQTYREAQQILDKRPLVREDIELARRKYSEAAAEFGRAVKYDDGPEKAAEAAKRTADAANPRYQDFLKLMADAVIAQREGDYPRAYELFGQAQSGFQEIGKTYDPTSQREAEEMRSRGDPNHALYAQGQTIFTEAVNAQTKGDYPLSYTKFREARDLFARAMSYDTSLMEAAREMRLKADRAHPSYAEGEAALADGNQRKDSLDFAGADAAFRKAIDSFNEASPYDANNERAADRARRRAYEKIPVSFAAGTTAMRDAEKARAEFRYADAYKLFAEAEEHFKRARFEEILLSEFEEAKRKANSGSEAFASAQSAEREALAAFNLGDGSLAQDKYEIAIRYYRQASVRIDGPEDKGGGGETSGSDEARQLERQAKRAKQDADELKSTTDGWNRAGEINQQTRSYYADANNLYEQALTAWNAKNWEASRARFQEAVALFSKVSNKKR